MEPSEVFACSFFEQLGFSVNKIPEAEGKRADLAVQDGIAEYIVEVKEKLDTGSQLNWSQGSYSDSGRKIASEPHSTSNRLDGIIKDARRQLASTPASTTALRLIFLVFTGPGADMFVRRALFTFYGVQQVVPNDGEGDGLNCVYFHNSLAFNLKDVDGLILMENEELQLCLNEFSANYSSMQESKLTLSMGGAIYDPARFAHDDGVVVLRSDISRRNEEEVLKELKRQAGIAYHTITLNRFYL